MRLRLPNLARNPNPLSHLQIQNENEQCQRVLQRCVSLRFPHGSASIKDELPLTVVIVPAIPSASNLRRFFGRYPSHP